MIRCPTDLSTDRLTPDFLTSDRQGSPLTAVGWPSILDQPLSRRAGCCEADHPCSGLYKRRDRRRLRHRGVQTRHQLRRTHEQLHGLQRRRRHLHVHVRARAKCEWEDGWYGANIL